MCGEKQKKGGTHTTGKRLLLRMSTHLAELIFPSTSVIVPTPSLQIHPKTLDTIEKNRVRWCRNRLHWTIQEQ
jgi:hypothetical protein